MHGGRWDTIGSLSIKVITDDDDADNDDVDDADNDNVEDILEDILGGVRDESNEDNDDEDGMM